MGRIQAAGSLRQSGMQAILLAALVIAGCARPGPARFGVDAGHANYHTADARYRPFAELLRRDGFVVGGVTGRLDAARLGALDVLVIANASAELEAGEIEATARWVRGGGALWLIADHAPFGGTVAPLARAFGVEMSNGLVGDEARRWEGADDPGNIVYERGAGLIADHPIVRGVARVVTFVGQSLRGPPGATAILTLSSAARSSHAIRTREGPRQLARLESRRPGTCPTARAAEPRDTRATRRP